MDSDYTFSIFKLVLHVYVATFEQYNTIYQSLCFPTKQRAAVGNNEPTERWIPSDKAETIPSELFHDIYHSHNPSLLHLS